VDWTESAAGQWLDEQGVAGITQHPNGESSFPDFIDAFGRPIEVSRLNQVSGQSGEPLMQDGIPITKTLKCAIKNASAKTKSWKTRYLVGFRYWRPIRNGIGNDVESALLSIVDAGSPPSKIDIGNCVSIRIEITDESFGDTFTLSAFGDSDAGGWVSEFVPKALAAAVQKKSNAVFGTTKNPNANATERIRKGVRLILVDQTGSVPEDFEGLLPDLRHFISLHIIAKRNGELFTLAEWGEPLGPRKESS
jgi:hypothetical protein